MSTKKQKPPNPKREPVISGSGAFFSAKDPAADADANLVGTIEWTPSHGTITLAIYPKDAKINGQPVTYETRMRGRKILSALVNSLQEFLRNRIVEYVGELGEKARKQIEDTFQIKGLNGIWVGDSDNLVTFNEFYQAGLSKEDAALQTFTGKQAVRIFGFTKVTFLEFEPNLKEPSVEEPPNFGFTKVTCIFF